MPQIKEVTVFTIQELSEKSKERALNEWAADNDYPFSSENTATLEKFAEILNLKIKNYCYGSYSSNDGVTWETSDYLENCEEVLNLSGVRLMKYFINNVGPFLSSGKRFYTSGYAKKRISKVIFESEAELTGYYTDDVIMQPIHDFIKKPSTHTFEDVINDCFSAWVKACSDDVEYQNSMESFIESCNANGYTFTEYGKMENI